MSGNIGPILAKLKTLLLMVSQSVARIRATTATTKIPAWTYRLTLAR